MRYAILLIPLIALLALACDDNGKKAGDEVEVEQSTLEALDEYSFTSDFDISSAAGGFVGTFRAQFQAPDSIQGTVTQEGEGSGLPGELELINIGGELWVREPGGEWLQPLLEDASGLGAFAASPLLILTSFGSPPLYLGLLDFDSLRLPTAGGAEDINGVSARPVRLDKAAIINLLGQGTFLSDEEGEPVPNSDVQQDAQEALPEDMVVQTWIAEDGGYPVRIIVTLSVPKGDGAEGAEAFLIWPAPVSIRLQMDITDTNIDVEIEPPPTAAQATTDEQGVDAAELLFRPAEAPAEWGDALDPEVIAPTNFFFGDAEVSGDDIADWGVVSVASQIYNGPDSLNLTVTLHRTADGATAYWEFARRRLDRSVLEEEGAQLDGTTIVSYEEITTAAVGDDFRIIRYVSRHPEGDTLEQYRIVFRRDRVVASAETAAPAVTLSMLDVAAGLDAHIQDRLTSP